MDYCGPRGIPLEEFLGWSETSQQAALMWQAHESRRHPDCGTHPDDWSPAAGGTPAHQHWHGEFCPGCSRKDAAAKALAADADAAAPGLRLVARPGSAGDCPTCRANT